eukprot:NODE_9194_length_1440_cov_12.662605.p1 GENE.NODE_9194_length_1440_cov_12.662605~~NODE_9194_length_1440_cov_12.662605.p1  ORF type:complete len:388 (-),score=129.25 NODE_9194_length_1440_cov_12.662605:275-1438(-)
MTELNVEGLPSGEWIERTESLGEEKGEIKYKVRMERQESNRLEKAAAVQTELEQEQAAEAEAAKAEAENGAGTICSIVVLSASNLPNTERGFLRRFGDCSDPYVYITAGDKHCRTATIDNCLNPVWNSQQLSLTLGENNIVTFEVFDYDALTFDDKLGEAQVQCGDLAFGEWQDLSLSLGDAGATLDIKLRLEKQAQGRLAKADERVAELGTTTDEAVAAAKDGAVQGAGHVVYAQVRSGHGLKEMESRLARMMGNTSDPYVKVILGEKMNMTDIIKNTREPVWEEDVFKFETNDSSEMIRFEVFDSDFLTKDDPMGAAMLEIGSIPAGEWTEQRLALGTGCGELAVKLRREDQPSHRVEKAAILRNDAWTAQQELREQRRQESKGR